MAVTYTPQTLQVPPPAPAYAPVLARGVTGGVLAIIIVAVALGALLIGAAGGFIAGGALRGHADQQQVCRDSGALASLNDACR